MKKLTGLPFYCFIFALYPPIALMANNITEEELSFMLRPVLLSALLSVILFLLALLIFRSSARAGILTLITEILFFSFGHILQSLETVSIAGFEPGRIRFLGPLFILIFIASIWFVMKMKRVSPQLNQTLTIISIALLIFPIYSIAAYSLQKTPSEAVKTAQTGPADQTVPAGDLPDIYYIIPDSYTRADVLADVFQQDNEPFLNELRQRGFYIADCSMSNYQYTLLSLSSSLNMDFLDRIDPRFNRGGYEEKTLRDLIQHSQVRSQLSQAGYTFVAFENDYFGTQIPNADVYIRYTPPQGSNFTGVSMNPYEEMFLQTTAGISFYRLNLGPISDWFQNSNYPNYKRAQIQFFEMDKLPEAAKIPGPKFVFVHFNIPHNPYIFTPQGELKTVATNFSEVPSDLMGDRIEGYRDQVQFMNSQLPGLVDRILQNSASEPIIIIQGDHGLDEKNRSAILNTYYVPEEIERQLYPSITPINTFRIILNTLLDRNEPLLPDQAYASDENDRFNVRPIEETREGCTR